MLLILDLDDTIFETKSIPSNVFQPVFEVVENHYKGHPIFQCIESDLWTNPFDLVAQKYAIPESVQIQFYQK